MISEIEKKRAILLELAYSNELQSKEVITCSQELDELLNAFYKKKLVCKNTLTHVSTIKNIIEGCIHLDKSIFNQVSYGNLAEKEQVWYPVNLVSSIFESLRNKYRNEILYEIGKLVSKNSIFPENVTSFECSLLTLNLAYHLNHKGDECNRYMTIVESFNKYSVIANTPVYPYEFNLGLLQGLADKYNTNIKVWAVNNVKGIEFHIDVQG